MFYAALFDPRFDLDPTELVGKRVDDVIGFDDDDDDEDWDDVILAPRFWGDGETRTKAARGAFWSYMDPDDDFTPQGALKVLTLETGEDDVVARADTRITPIRLRHKMILEWGGEPCEGSVECEW